MMKKFFPKKHKLLYQSTRHGFSAKAWHAEVDGKAPTVTYVLTKTKRMFGGYTNIKW